MDLKENIVEPSDVVRILLYLYSVVMALSLTTSVNMTVAPFGEVISLTDLSAQSLSFFGTFFITLVPFYHGASLHIIKSYRSKNKKPKKGEPLIDFFALSIEAIIFFAMSRSIGKLHTFIGWFGALLLLDLFWVCLTYYKSQDETGQAPTWWAILNGGMIVFLLLFWGFFSY